jgi:predicted ester cyclase
LNELKSAFPDLRTTIEDQYTDGDFVFNRTTITGTHNGDFQGYAPTGKRFETSGLTMFKVSDGKIREQWVEVNVVRALSQIGVFNLGDDPNS